MRKAFSVIALMGITLAASLPALALAAETIESPIIQHASWPEGLADLLNSRPRVYSYFVNMNDYLYYRGDSKELSEFLALSSALGGLIDTLLISPGKKLTGHFDNPEEVDIPYDWAVSVLTEWHSTEKSTKTRVELRILTGGSVSWDKVKVPRAIKVIDCRHRPDSPKPEFGIYLPKDKSINSMTAWETLKVDLERHALAEKALIGMEDIVWYRWRDHTFKLTPEAAQRVPRTGVWGIPFVFVADGKRAYAGAFWTTDSSASFPRPVILSDRPPVDDARDAGDRTVFTIERAYPGPTEEQLKDDPRNAPAIKAALEKAGKLK